MIDAWDVYWVMQLDSIIQFGRAWFCLGGTASLIGLIASFLFEFSERDLPIENQSKHLMKLASSVRWWLWPLFFISFTAGFLSVFIPSSRTAAAMHVLPAIVNNEEVHQEMKEIYDLAKDGLKQLVKAENE